MTQYKPREIEEAYQVIQEMPVPGLVKILKEPLPNPNTVRKRCIYDLVSCIDFKPCETILERSKKGITDSPLRGRAGEACKLYISGVVETLDGELKTLYAGEPGDPECLVRLLPKLIFFLLNYTRLGQLVDWKNDVVWGPERAGFQVLKLLGCSFFEGHVGLEELYKEDFRGFFGYQAKEAGKKQAKRLDGLVNVPKGICVCRDYEKKSTPGNWGNAVLRDRATVPWATSPSSTVQAHKLLLDIVDRLVIEKKYDALRMLFQRLRDDVRFYGANARSPHFITVSTLLRATQATQDLFFSM